MPCCTVTLNCLSQPVQELGALALGAGVGEEALFRAFLQTSAVTASAAAGVPAGMQVAAGVGIASVVFGALHAVTPVSRLAESAQ